MKQSFLPSECEHGIYRGDPCNRCSAIGRIDHMSGNRDPKRVYLAGPIFGSSDAECRDWRERVKAHWPQCVDPMVRDYRGLEDEAYEDIVENDKADIDTCGTMLVYFSKPSVGTSMEMLYAWERRIKIVLLVNPATKLSPWLRYHATVIVHTLQEALDALKAL